MRTLSIIACLLAAPSYAQSMTPEEIAKMIDQRAAALNPYQALLNDPDPFRSMEAMLIMMGSGDPDLLRIAREYGLTSPDVAVRQAAVKAYLATEPVLSVELGGKDFKEDVTGFGSMIGPDNMSYARSAIGPYDDGKKCFTEAGTGDCLATLYADSIQFAFYGAPTRMTFDDDGYLRGYASIVNIKAPVPVTIRLID